MIESERSNPQVDQTRLQSLYALKLFIGNFDSYEKMMTYAKILDSVVDRADQYDVFITRKIALAMEPAIRREEDIAQVITDLQSHMALIEQTAASRRLDDPVLQVGKLRLDLDKVSINVLEGYTSAVRGFCSSVHTVNTMTDNKLDLLDQEQLAILEQAFVAVLNQLDKLRQACTDASKLYTTSPMLGKTFGQFANFSYSLCNALMVVPLDLNREVDSLKSFNLIFGQLENIFDKIQNEVNVVKNEATLAMLIKDFNDHFSKLTTEFNTVGGSVDQVRRLFVEVNLQEFLDAYDYMTMIKEVLTSVNKILDERVKNGYADVTFYKELELTLEDKPDVLIDLGSNFRANFS